MGFWVGGSGRIFRLQPSKMPSVARWKDKGGLAGRRTRELSVGFYNLFNFAYFDLPTSTMSGLLTATAGTINGADPASHNTNRVGVGTSAFPLGSPREIEFGLQIAF